MGFLFLKNKRNDIKPQYTGLQVQTSSSSMPIPLLFGTNSLAPNLIWYDNFQTIKREERQGGKGGGAITTTSYTYTADVIMGLCEGPITGVLRVWKDKAETTLADEGLTLFVGDNPQDAWPYLVTNYPTKALAYNGLAYVADNGYALTDAATIRNHNFEVQGLLAGSLADIGNTADADVALAIQAFLTNPQFGTYFPAAYIDEATLLGGSATSSLQCYCKAVGFGLSPAIASAEKAASIIERWLMLVNATVIWSDGLLKFIPYAEDDLTGNGFTWVARTTPVYDLDDDDFVALNDDDPVKIERIDVAHADNILRLEIADRSNRYSKTPIEIRDESSIQLYGPKIADTIQANELCSAEMASLSGNMLLNRRLYIRNRYRFKLSWEYCLLEPMDVVTITDTRLGLNQLAVRIDTIEETDNGELDVVAEDLVAGLSAPTLYPKQPVTNNPINQGELAPPVNPPLLFEAPISLTGGVPQIWIGASGLGGSLKWGGCQVWVSTDDATYMQLGQVDQRANQGVLTAALPAYTGAPPDNTNAAEVDLTMSAGSLLSTSTAEAQAGLTLCIIGDELFSFTTATLTGPNAYSLTGLWRGQQGSPITAHPAGAAFCRLDNAIAKIDLPAAYIGRTLYVKLVSFNVFGQGLQDISTVTAYQFTPTGASYGFNSPLLNRLAAGQATDLGSTATTEPGADLGSTAPPTTATINLGNI